MHQTVDNYIEKGYYVHSKKLGQGGFGVVKLATHLATGKQVAVKIIDKQKIEKDLFRVRTEISALKVLRHKNIAKLLQVIEDDKTIYLIMEYCAGGELFDYLIERGSLSDEEARKIIRSLVKVLRYIHAKGFSHRDIKPENILFDKNLNLKLIDFGLAAKSTSLSSPNVDLLSTCCGSPAYVAPELLCGMKYRGPAIDVWSTGVVMYALLVGRLPFQDQNIGVLYKKIKSGHFSIPSFVNPKACDLLKRMLCVNVDNRISVDDVLVHPWIEPLSINDTIVSSETADEMCIDDQILMKVAVLLPEYDNLKKLREEISANCGYAAATYWIAKDTPEEFMDLEYIVKKDTINRRRSRSYSQFAPSPLASSAKKANLNIEKNCSNHKSEHKSIKVDAFKVGVNNGVNNTKLLSEKNCVQRQVAKQLFSLPKEQVTICKKKGLNQTLKENLPVKKPVNLVHRDTPMPQTHRTNIHRQQMTPLATRTTLRTTPLFKRLPNSNTKKVLNKVKSVEKIPLPPTQRSADSALMESRITPKKSLLKRLLEYSTPRKISSPRRFSLEDKNVIIKNITMTNFTNATECIDCIVRVLNAKMVNCKTNNYTIRCVLSSKNVIIVAFELELLVCRNTGCIGIQRKRLKGTSWDYVKICEELKHVQKEFMLST